MVARTDLKDNFPRMARKEGFIEMYRYRKRNQTDKETGLISFFSL